MAGCCYGKICQGGLSVNYITMIENRVDENLRFPVQLAESLFEFLVFIYLLLLLKSEKWKTKKLLLRYLAIYSLGRFLLEFLRGDFRRGLIYGISFSQCVSVLIWIVLMGDYFKQQIILKQKREDCNG